MKKLFSIILCLLVLCSSAFLFSSCKKKDDDNNVVDYTSPSSEYVYVTNANGEIVTDANGNPVTQVKGASDSKETTSTRYSVKGGSDPYVEDIWG